MALTQESVLSFLLDRGGKVRNSELVNHFKSLISGGGDPAEKQHNRELFKRLVNSVAVVRQLDDVKFVVVKKRYQDFVKEDAEGDAQNAQMDESFARTPPVRVPAEPDRRTIKEDNNKGRVEESRSLSDSTALRVLSLSGEQPCRAGKSGAVFAVIAVQSPGRDSAPASNNKTDTQQAPQTANSSCKVGSFKTSQSWESKRSEGVMNPPVSHHLVRPQSKTRAADEASKYSESVPLDPLGHEWLVKCAAGLWGQIYALMLRDTRLVQRKDFMSGFTALHWAAKAGNRDMVLKLMEISNRKDTRVNVNSKSHGGYTPLHIAAMHGHDEVMVLLVQHYGANVNERDNNGKKAFHYLQKGASAEVRGLLGGLVRERTEDEDYKEHTKGFNTISKLFHPHPGRKHKNVKFAHEW
uniref:Sosondowah ankyrin repeat domain family member A n=1 Tax=Nothobranchius rachovii TaxID=451742 RepID=A0A1A8RDT7_9TELE